MGVMRLAKGLFRRRTKQQGEVAQSVINEAEALVANQLGMLDALYAARKVQMEAKSHLICHCRSCVSAGERTCAWLRAMYEKAPGGSSANTVGGRESYETYERFVPAEFRGARREH